MGFERSTILMLGLEFCLQLLYQQFQAANFVAQLLNICRWWRRNALRGNKCRRGGRNRTRRRRGNACFRTC